MKVLQISASYKPAFVYGGPTMSVSMLSEQLSLANCQVSVFTTTANGLHELDVTPGAATNVEGVTVIYFKRKTKDHSHFSPALLKALWFHGKEYDIIHIHAWWNMVSVLTCLIAVCRSISVVVSPRGTLSPYSFQNKNRLVKSLIHRIITKPLLKRSHLHVTSHREQEAIGKLVEPKSITNIPNFVKLSPAKNLDRNPSLVFKIIFLSRIEDKKGLDILISALPALNFPFSLSIVGDGDETYVNQLKAMADKTGLSEKISWMGFQTDNKFNLLNLHDLLVLPSHDENFGNVVIESLSQGTAVLISRAVGLSTYVEENNLGWLCDRDAADVSYNLNLIYKKQERLANIRKNAPAKIKADFAEDTLVKQYINMYYRILS